MNTINGVEASENVEKHVLTPFTSKKHQPNTSSKEVGNNVYKYGFFVHKTIRELAINTDGEMPQAEAEIGTQNNYKQNQIDAVKKEVQQKAANLSPVLQNRSTSKVILKTYQQNTETGQHQPHAKPNASLSKYKSPLRTTLKSSVSMASHKDSKIQPQMVTKTPVNKIQHQQHLSNIGQIPNNSGSSRVCSPKNSRRHPINSLTIQGMPSR